MLKAMLREAWQAMGANRLRTILTMLGMVIGVGSVVLMMAIGQGAQYAVAQTISTMGSNLYILISGSTSTGGLRSGGGGGPTLTVADAEAIAELDGVKSLPGLTLPPWKPPVLSADKPETMETLGTGRTLRMAPDALSEPLMNAALADALTSAAAAIADATTVFLIMLVTPKDAPDSKPASAGSAGEPLTA